MADAFNWADEITKTPTASPAEGEFNWADEITGSPTKTSRSVASGKPAPKSFDIDFNRPVAEVRKSVGQLNPDDRKEALRQWADTFVAKERAGGGTVNTVMDRLRNVAQGFPVVGAFADELNAGTAAAAHKLTGGAMGAPYDEAKAYQDARDRAADENSTHLFTVPTNKLTMGLLPDLPVSTADAARFAGAVPATKLLPRNPLMRGESLLPATVNALGTGVAVGAMHGAGMGNGIEERGWNALTGGALGGLLGGLTVPLFRGVANTAAAARDQFTPRPAPLREYSPRAVANVSDAATADNVIGGPTFNRAGSNSYQTQALRLGPEATLADMGPNLASEAGGVASLPGTGKKLITETLGRTTNEGRASGAAGRIKADADLVLGPAENLVQAEQAARAIGGARAKPYYDEFYATEIKPSEGLITMLRRLPRGVWDKAQGLATAEGVDLAQTANTGRGVDLIKRGLDDYIEGLTKGTNEYRIFSQLQKNIVGEVDAILSPGNPAASSWAKGRQEAGDWIRYRKGIEAGQEAFKKGTHPDQMRADLAASDMQFRSGYEHGARGQVRDIIGNSATSFGPSGASEARRQLGSEYAREKLDLVTKATPLARTGSPVFATNRADGIVTSYTRAPADRLTNRLDTEGVFEGTRQKVLGNSVTAERTAAQKRYAAPGDNDPAIRSSSLYSDVKSVVIDAANKLSGNYLTERATAIAADAAEMLMAQGARRDEIARALTQHARSRATSARLRAVLLRVARDISVGAKPVSIDAATSQQAQ